MKKILSLLLGLSLVLGCSAGAFASSEEPEEAVSLSDWADDLYEPDTTVALPATIVWPADETAEAVATADVRPNTMIVSIDAELNVSTLDGETISDDLTAYLTATKNTALTAFYLSDGETASAFSDFCAENEVNDVIVIASAENAYLVQTVCTANTGVIGAIDFTDAGLDTSTESLYSVVTTTNSAHCKIAILPEDVADYDSIDYLHGMVISVWVETEATDEAIYTTLTNGANGIVCADYQAVNDALESFDDVTTLLRHTLISGHRGLPSEYVENTIRGTQAAIDAGADVVECDIQLSADGEIFILHDDDAARLFDREDITDIEALTMDEIRALAFDMTDDTAENAPNSVLNSNNTNRTTANREDTVLDYDADEDYIPTLREYLEALGDEDVIFFIEIKTENPDIVEPFKALCEEMGVMDKVVVITFQDGWCNNGYEYYSIDSDVLAEMQRVWPECSLGYLGYDGGSNADLTAIIEENDGAVGEAVGTLLTQLNVYNSTYHNSHNAMSYEVISAARHRGLLANPWTYNTETAFATGYLTGIYSLTTNFSTWATDLPVQIQVEDATVSADGGEISFSVIAQNGETIENPKGISLVTISGPEVSYDAETGAVTADGTGEALVMVRMDCELDVNGYDLEAEGIDTAYAIYSNPFTITVTE
ncbi:MAG: hypothetical protein LUC89_03205 [Oscillospiraceae bacterium]|nr:hypothetical protein [Oscillospiraceae bacterium]